MRLVALDLLRFFAALSVVLYHYIPSSFEMLSEISKYGYLGVPLFFMISGYVIALSANNRTAFEFAISRFVRLYPGLWAGIGVTLLVTSFFNVNNYGLVQILVNLTLLNDYFGINDLDGVYWTLHVELKFYACIFLLLLFGFFHKYKIWLTIWMLLTVMHLLFNEPFFMGWFISPGYSSFFIAGVVLNLIHKEGTNLYNQLMLFSSLMLSSLYGFEQASQFMSNTDDVDKIISVFIIWFFYLLFYLLIKDKMQCTKRSIYITLGGLTYPLYLIHNVAGKQIIHYLNTFLPEQISIIITIMLMLFFSGLIFYGVERKIATPMKLFLLKVLNNMKIFANKTSKKL